MPSWIAAAGQRAQQAAHGVRQRVTVDPEVAEQVTMALMTAVIGAAGEHSAKIHPMAKIVGPALAKSVGPMVAASTARQVRKGLEKGYRPGTAGQAEASGEAADADVEKVVEEGTEADAENTGEPSDASTAHMLSELADDFGVRPPPDPEALYRPDSGPMELLFPLPGDLAALPWSPLSHRDRFFVLVAAWALREADGIQLLRSGDFGQASEVFQECVARAKQMQSAELIARSYEDLAEQAVESGNEAAAKVWRAAAEHERQEEATDGR